MKSGLFVFFISCPLLAQFSQLAATDDGQQVYFVSTLPLATEPPNYALPEIYRIAGNGVELFAASNFSSGSGSASSPQLSGNGRVVGITRDGNGELLGGGAAVLGPGSLTMSRNGPWAALTVQVQTGTPFPFQPVPVQPQETLIDTATGARTVFPLGQSLEGVASNGTLLLEQNFSNPMLWRQGTYTPVTLPAGSSVGGITDDGQTLFYRNSQLQLVLRNLASGTDTPITLPDSGQVRIWSSSNHGDWMLCIQNGGGQAFVVNTTTGQSIPLSLGSGESATSGVLSGYGNKAFLTTSTGRIVSFDAQVGANLQTLVPAPTWVPNIAEVTLFPGSQAVFNTVNLAAASGDLTGKLFLNGIPLPVVWASASQIAVQVPWELQAPQFYPLRIDLGDSPFRQNQILSTFPMFPHFLPLGPGQSSVLGFVAVRGDFSGLLTTQPNPGDVIVVYATGMGPVNGPMVTGQPPPAGSTVSIQGQISCYFYPYSAPAETLFAGLAPGLLGLYQINFRLPSGPNPGPITSGFCTYSGPGRNGGFTWNATP